MTVMFSKEDDQGVQFSCNDAVVITMNVENYGVCCILIDNESSTDILYFDTLMKIGIFFDRLTPLDSLLVRFTGDTIQVEGMISLTIRMGYYLFRSIAQVDFLVV